MRQRSRTESESERRLIHPLFSNMEGGWQCYRSCGVVRSIMSPSRGDDPGSNPGTSTKHVIRMHAMLFIVD